MIPLVLTLADFPLVAMGPCVYRRSESSPIFTTNNDHMAADIVARLNREEMNKWRGGGYVPCHEMVYG